MNSQVSVLCFLFLSALRSGLGSSGRGQVHCRQDGRWSAALPSLDDAQHRERSGPRIENESGTANGRRSSDSHPAVGNNGEAASFPLRLQQKGMGALRISTKPRASTTTASSRRDAEARG